VPKRAGTGALRHDRQLALDLLPGLAPALLVQVDLGHRQVDLRQGGVRLRGALERREREVRPSLDPEVVAHRLVEGGPRPNRASRAA
jgi:hypothetical protein